MIRRKDPETWEMLERQVTHLTTGPGVYIMRGVDGDAIYIGKAKNLKARVRSYFRGGDGRIQISYLMRRVMKIETIVTTSEEQAFVLERDLITKYKPRYNIKLKDDKQYYRIRIDLNAEWPRIDLVRREEDDGARYFGPYAMSYELRNLLEVVKKVVPLRTCSDPVLYNRQRPCLEYQIKRCAGPCCLPVDRHEYIDWVKKAISILEGKSKSIVQGIKILMDQASEDLRFEEAAAWRDRLAILERFDAGHNTISHRGEAKDVFALYREDTQATLCILNVRSGRIVDTKLYTLADVAVPDETILEEAITQYYHGGRELPVEIILPIALDNSSLLTKILSERRGHAVEMTVPERGSKHRLVSIGEINARQHFVNQVAGEGGWNSVAMSLAKLLSLSQLPRRIECVDISTFQRTDTVGALVCFFDGLPDRSNYRRFIIKGEQVDDFASIYEVVHRRLSRGAKEESLPDLLVIDGGAQQLQSALRARDELKVNLDIVALAKMRTASDVTAKNISRKPERVFLPTQSDPIDLAASDPMTRFFQRIRDEVHEYVITFHRQRRSKRVFRSKLDDIPGVGVGRRNRLLKHYGSVKHMKDVDVSEFAKVGRMPLALAEKVLRELKKM